MSHDYFDETVAGRYDESVADDFAPDVIESTVDFLAELAGDGPALEMGIGTGRVALPLARRGLSVHGIDLSPAMIDRLRAKPGADAIPVTIGDFATTRLEQKFSLVYLVFNTIMNLTTQEEQVACFQNAAAHLRPAGHFVIEVMIPRLQRLPVGERIFPFKVTASQIGFDEYDVVTQHLVSHHYQFSEGNCDRSSAPYRYVWPSELDLMARLAGMTLRERHSDWNRTPIHR